MDACALKRELNERFLYWAYAFALGNGAAELAITLSAALEADDEARRRRPPPGTKRRHAPRVGSLVTNHRRRASALSAVHVRRVPVSPVRRGYRLVRVVVLGGLVQQVGQRGDVHVSPAIPARAAAS